jgi:hypothetical protein
MRWGRSAARFCDEVLALHPSILKVFLLEQRANRFTIVEEAAQVGIGPVACDINQFLSSRSLVLSDSGESQIGVPKLLGVLYGNEAIMFTRINDHEVLAVCAEPAGFEEVLQAVNRALPTLTGEPDARPTTVPNPISATEGAAIARSYVANLARTPDVSIDEVTLHQNEHTWEIQGSYRSNPFARSRRFQLQLASGTGAVTGFISPQRQSLAPLVVGTGVVLGTLFFLVWLLLLIR